MDSLHTVGMSSTMPSTNCTPMQPGGVLIALAEAGWQAPSEQREALPPTVTNGDASSGSGLTAHADRACSCCHTGPGFSVRRRGIRPLPTPRPTLNCSEVTVDRVDRD
jgi:hypothetical protein